MRKRTTAPIGWPASIHAGGTHRGINEGTDAILTEYLDGWLLRGNYELREAMVIGPYITADCCSTA